VQPFGFTNLFSIIFCQGKMSRGLSLVTGRPTMTPNVLALGSVADLGALNSQPSKKVDVR
jgi:hypothetical protein